MTTRETQSSPTRPVPAPFPPVLALLRPLARAIDWLPIAVVALLAVSLAAVMSPGNTVDPRLGLLLLRTTAVLLGAAATFALVDAMTANTGSAPVPRWVRQWTRTLMVGVAVAASWGVTCAVVAIRLTPGGVLHFSGAALEAGVCALVGLAGAAIAVRRHPGRQAALAGVLVQLVLYAGTQITGDLAWPMPDSSEWDAIHRWWLAALPMPLLVLAGAHRDTR
ncbi:hypothetical protein [Streptosporangium sp. NPDC000396]|uniref:hypothetical protein n=1 Tax=Streptosporangium sp. NPDC000396 TaxID=3366185 RepID=UPI00368B3B35